jgi:hypothetical protein
MSLTEDGERAVRGGVLSREESEYCEDDPPPPILVPLQLSLLDITLGPRLRVLSWKGQRTEVAALSQRTQRD